MRKFLIGFMLAAVLVASLQGCGALVGSLVGNITGGAIGQLARDNKSKAKSNDEPPLLVSEPGSAENE